jgi:hypothetical protein
MRERESIGACWVRESVGDRLDVHDSREEIREGDGADSSISEHVARDRKGGMSRDPRC